MTTAHDKGHSEPVERRTAGKAHNVPVVGLDGLQRPYRLAKVVLGLQGPCRAFKALAASRGVAGGFGAEGANRYLDEVTENSFLGVPCRSIPVLPILPSKNPLESHHD